VIRDPRFDMLFEPVKIGPVVAKNRFLPDPPPKRPEWRRSKSPGTSVK
jgi:dimethylamine/trimethylamine dehydrogenase